MFGPKTCTDFHNCKPEDICFTCRQSRIESDFTSLLFPPIKLRLYQQCFYFHNASCQPKDICPECKQSRDSKGMSNPSSGAQSIFGMFPAASQVQQKLHLYAENPTLLKSAVMQQQLQTNNLERKLNISLGSYKENVSYNPVNFVQQQYQERFYQGISFSGLLGIRAQVSALISTQSHHQNLIICKINEQVGHGVFASNFIQKNKVLCVYAGIMAQKEGFQTAYDDEALGYFDGKSLICSTKQHRGIGSFLQHFPTEENFDLAEWDHRTVPSNICKANVTAIHMLHENKPLIALITTRLIEQYEQLGFDYGLEYFKARKIVPEFFDINTGCVTSPPEYRRNGSWTIEVEDYKNNNKKHSLKLDLEDFRQHLINEIDSLGGYYPQFMPMSSGDGSTITVEMNCIIRELMRLSAIKSENELIEIQNSRNMPSPPSASIQVMPQQPSIHICTNPGLCGQGFHPGTTLKQCSRCKKVSYCSIECQRKHWTQHKLLCAHAG